MYIAYLWQKIRTNRTEVLKYNSYYLKEMQLLFNWDIHFGPRPKSEVYFKCTHSRAAFCLKQHRPWAAVT